MTGVLSLCSITADHVEVILWCVCSKKLAIKISSISESSAPTLSDTEPRDVEPRVSLGSGTTPEATLDHPGPRALRY